ncbi:MAG: peptidoglycan bridge formation glycyltransferase FemA/FemB family protein [Chitinispirillaceae bacterium]|nr:peptidoglycan bridge formation glycyltransferase FemA/FemB family protein [Chitinispirillaceae bacterium]
MPDIQIVNPLDIPDWDTRVLSFPEATIFHSAAWARVLIESYGFLPHYCVNRQGDEITGILPLMEVRDILGRKKAVSLPFTDFCEPLFNDTDDFQKTFEHIAGIAQNKKWRSIELRGGHQNLANQPVYDEIFTHEIDLTPEPDAIFKSFADSNRRNIRKAKKSGITVTHENSLDAMKSFYFLNCLTRREHGLPPQPWIFFYKLLETILRHEKGFITLATYQHKPVAANLYMTFGKKALYKYGASDRRFQHLRPNNMAMWEGIRKCKSLGAVAINLGRTEIHHTGLLQFKRGYGCQASTVNYYRFDYIRNKFERNSGSQHTLKIQSFIFSHLPIPISRLVGQMIFKYAG